VLLLAVTIALLGITNTLALSIFERTREVGLLRAVGATRTQIAAMVRWEALLVAVLGGVVCVTLGVVFGWAAVGALGSRASMTLTIPTAQLAVFIGVAAVAGLLAGVLPARRAARLDVLAAISSE
jgi:putative ABC transport system permease protein